MPPRIQQSRQPAVTYRQPSTPLPPPVADDPLAPFREVLAETEKQLARSRAYDASRFAPRDEDALERLASRWYDSDLLPAAYYPEWEKTVNGQKVEIKYSNEDLIYYRNRGISRAVIVMRYGASLGVLPELAIRLIYIVEGQPAPAAALMLALAFSSGALRREDWEVVEAGPTKVAIRLFGSTRKTPMLVDAEYGDYKHLHKKTNWMNYPEDMLFARATSRAMRRYFPDMFAGVYCAEERLDMGDDRLAGRSTESVVEQIMSQVDHETRRPVASPPSVVQAPEPDAPQAQPTPEQWLAEGHRLIDLIESPESAAHQDARHYIREGEKVYGPEVSTKLKLACVTRVDTLRRAAQEQAS